MWGSRRPSLAVLPLHIHPEGKRRGELLRVENSSDIEFEL